MIVDEIPGQSPYLTKAPNGNPILSWVRMSNDSPAAFCFAFGNNDGTFGDPIVVPNSTDIQPHGENLPKIIAKPTGEIIALWGIANPNPKNKYSGLIYYAQTFDNGKSWTDPKPLVNDTASFDQRYYDVALLPDGEAGIVWLDNPNRGEHVGSNVYFAKTLGREGFEKGKLISHTACQCCRTVLFTDAAKNVHVLYRAIIQDSIRDMVHIVSTNRGKSFSTPKRISDDNWVMNACPHTGPSMTENAHGLHFAWYTGGTNSGCYYTQTPDKGGRFINKVSIRPVGSHPQIATLSNNEMMIVWDEFVTRTAPFRRIGVQRLDEQGNKKQIHFITSDTTFATYPVVAALDRSSALIAYTLKISDKNHIAYQVLAQDHSLK